jgi:hypothetical protein
MDVVRRNVESLRGSLEISSRPGGGTTICLRLPLTLAIIDGLLVRIAGAHFVAPLANVLECIELTAQDVREAHGKHLVKVRGELVPYIRLREYFRVPGARPDIDNRRQVLGSFRQPGLPGGNLCGRQVCSDRSHLLESDQGDRAGKRTTDPHHHGAPV